MRHMVTHSGESAHKCETCGRAFAEPCLLKRHEVLHTGQKFPCDICDKSSRKDYSELHMMQHRGEAKHSYEACGKMFTLSCRIKIHQVWHTVSRPYSCKKCSKSFLRENSLKTPHVNAFIVS